MDWPSQYCWLSVQMPFSNSSIYLLLRLQNKKKLDSHINWRNIERFSHDLEWKRANKTETTNKAIWLVYRTDTKARGFWLFKRTLEWKNVIPENFLEINRYFALTSYCNTIGQLNNAFSILAFFLAGNEESMFCSFHHWMIKQITNTSWNHFSRSYENRSNFSAVKISKPCRPELFQEQ